MYSIQHFSYDISATDHLRYMGSRCANCPSRGCKNCPMFGVGLNPEFQKKEERRTTKLAKKKMQKEMESKNKRAEL